MSESGRDYNAGYVGYQPILGKNVRIQRKVFLTESKLYLLYQP